MKSKYRHFHLISFQADALRDTEFEIAEANKKLDEYAALYIPALMKTRTAYLKMLNISRYS
jgi:hypothetical protein